MYRVSRYYRLTVKGKQVMGLNYFTSNKREESYEKFKKIFMAVIAGLWPYVV